MLIDIVRITYRKRLMSPYNYSIYVYLFPPAQFRGLKLHLCVQIVICTLVAEALLDLYIDLAFLHFGVTWMIPYRKYCSSKPIILIA